VQVAKWGNSLAIRLPAAIVEALRQMSVDHKVFFDTNVLLYLLSADIVKADTAEAVIGSGGVFNVQVMNEFVNVCQR